MDFKGVYLLKTGLMQRLEKVIATIANISARLWILLARIINTRFGLNRPIVTMA